MTAPGRDAVTVLTLADAGLVAAVAAARLVSRLVEVQAEQGWAHLVLTGGGVGTATLAALADSPARDAVDWQRLDLWWGDERFLPEGHPDRNETQARAALLDRVPVPAERVHPMPADDGSGVTAGAARYAEELALAAAGAPDGVPPFAVVLLGVGPDGHVASLFPDHPALTQARTAATAIPVTDSPKPPPTRISLSFTALARAEEVWLLAAGAEKADAVARALDGTDPAPLPAATVRGRQRTLWFLDRAAAGGLSG